MTTGHYRQVQIDVCPKCHGTWLDKAEIEKILGDAYVPITEAERQTESKVLTFLDLALGISRHLVR